MSSQDTAFSIKIREIFNPNSTPIVMGILNITPDSFYDGGAYNNTKDCLIKVEKMLDDGATIIDVGAYSTKPGAIEISVDEEWDRLCPILPLLRSTFPSTLFSIDSYRAEIVKRAVDNGINIINDISGGTMDKEMFKVVSQMNVPYVLTHIQGTPKNMQLNPIYQNVTKEVYGFFENQIKRLNALNFNQIILDPGFGFGKNLNHNYSLLNNLECFKTLNYPILVGVSRKSMITKLLDIEKEDALNGTTIINTIALEKGANILRVHDTLEAKQAIDIFMYYKKQL